MQFKSITLLVLLLGLVALVQGAAVASPHYNRPNNYNQGNCQNQCHNALKPVSDRCNSAYPSHNGGHRRDGSTPMNLGQSVDIESIFSSISLGEFSEGCHKCFFVVAITCIFNYSQTYWSSTFFSECIDTTIVSCWNT